MAGLTPVGLSAEDICFGDNQIREMFCNNENELEPSLYDCPNGCQDGACVGEEIDVVTSIDNEPVEIPENDEENKITYICQGCELDNKCYPLGYRKSGEYCSDDLVFVEQSNKESACENNFECGSNLCVDSQCIEEGFFRKIMNWFKRLFG